MIRLSGNAVFVLLIVLLAAACGTTPRRHITATMDDVESYVNDRPDSALAVLEGVDSTALNTRALRARYSLLHVMALDKCYKDITAPGLLDPAVEWYERHGTADEKMKVRYYQGRLEQQIGNLNSAAVLYYQAEQYVAKCLDKHAVALLYIAVSSVYNTVYNLDKEQEYAERALAELREANDPMYQSSLGNLALVYHSRKDWNKADSLYREAIDHSDSYPHAKSVFLSNYARMKLLQPDQDPEGAKTLLDQKRKLLGGGLTPQEAGAYAYAAGLLGDRNTEESLTNRLREMAADEREQALPWLYRIALLHNDTSEALDLHREIRIREDEMINNVLSDTVSSALQDYNRWKSEYERNRRLRDVYVLVICLLLVALGAISAVFHRKRVEVERDGLLRLSLSLEKEMKEALEQNKLQAIQLEERTELLSEGEKKLKQIKEEFNRERMNRFRQAGNIGSIIWLKEKKRITDAAAWRLMRQELVYIHHLEGNGAELIRRMDRELDGMVSRLRKDLHLIGKPQEVLFLCCCILDMDAQVLADLTGKNSVDAIYKKRSRLKAKILSLGNPDYNLLFKGRPVR